MAIRLTSNNAERLAKINAEKWEAIREKRNSLIAQSDWTQMRDQSDEVANKWAPYRQALRDITLGDDPDAVEWPTEPD